MATMVSGLGGPAGYGENVFSTTTKSSGNNDDGSVQVDITSVFGDEGLQYYDTDYTSIYINSNGNISFGAAQTAYVPNLGGTTTPTLAPFWADVNINSGGEIYWDLDPTAGTVTITWLDVAPYSGSGTNSFQVVLTSTGDGNFEVEYIYEDITWTSGGSGQAQTGYTDGGSNDTFLEGSGNATELAGYETNDFDGGDPAGAYSVDFNNGEPDFRDGTVTGTSGADVIDASFDDDEGDSIDDGGFGGDNGPDDSVEAGDGNDTVTGGAGDDTLLGQGGDDVIYGDYNTDPATTSENIDWTAGGADEADVSGGLTLNTGEMDVRVTMIDDGTNNPDFEIESSDTQYVGSGEPMSTTSSLYLYGNGTGDTSTARIDFAADAESYMSDEVENVIFRINDLDSFAGNHIDTVTVRAYDAEGNAVTVTLTASGDETVTGNTATAGGALDTSADANGSLLVEIAGPVARIEIDYGNNLNGTHGINITDIHFDTILPPAGSDSIDGGAGDDTIDGEAGDDTIIGGTGDDVLTGGAGDDIFYVAEGDLATGGEGDDLFVLTDLGESGSGTITITGGETGESAGAGGGDTLDLNGIADRTTLTFTNTDDNAGGLSGTIELLDGTVVTFSEIENIICFTPGTMILTAAGPRPVESLAPGDLVITRDSGARPLSWVGRSNVPATGPFAPIHLAAAALPDATRDLLVSPQHRFLVEGWQAELNFGAEEVLVSAKHLLGMPGVTQRAGGRVSYIHLMFDRHEVIYAEGTATESFFLGDLGLTALREAQREEIFRAFPGLRGDIGGYGPTARPCAKAHEGLLLAA